MTVWNGNRTLWQNRASAMVPHQSWRFGVKFRELRDQEIDFVFELLSEEIISITLPTFKDTVTTRNFINTRRSYITGRDTTGSISIKFNIRPLGNPMYNILNMAYMNWDNGGNGMNAKTYLEPWRTFGSVEITMFGTGADAATQKQITLQNVLITDVNISDLNYESNDKVTCSMNMHYDNWYWSGIDHTA